MPPAAPTPILADVLNRLARYGKCQRSGAGWSAHCPAHQDKNPSLSAADGDKAVVMTCFTGCTLDAITGAIGMKPSELFYDNENKSAPIDPLPFPTNRRDPAEKLVAIYDYTDGIGTVTAQKARFEVPGGKKTFRWRQAGEERWSGGVEIETLALWGAEEVTRADPERWVYYVEGEKAVEACREAGLLAVTHGGGAGTKSFGTSLEVLAGHNVALWADNDATGREYMARVDARLRGLAKTVRVVNVPLPPKGDAFEYFQAGGTVEDLEDTALAITGPSVEFLADDALRIRMPVVDGVINFTFTDMEKSARNFEALLRVEVDAPASLRIPFEERVNLSSNNGKTELRRDLDEFFGKKYGWSQLMNQAFALTRDRYLNLDRSIDLYDIEDGDDQQFFLIDPLVPMDAPTIIFGSGGSMKSYLVFLLAYCIATGTPFLGFAVRQMPVLVVDYEDSKTNFRRRMRRIADGLGLPFLPGLVHYWPAKGIPLKDLAEALRRKVVNDGVGFMILDSIGPAAAGKPEEALVAMDLFRALAKINVTSVLLAHVPKNAVGQQQPEHPFGSVFYTNEARRTWYVEKAQDEESDEFDVGLFCKKVNDGPRPHPLSIHIEFTGLHGPVRLSLGRMAEVPSLQQKRDLKYQIWDALERSGRSTVKELAKELEAEEAKVRKSLDNNPKMFLPVDERRADGARGRPEVVWGRAARN